MYFGFVLTSYYYSMKTTNMKPVPTSFDRVSGGFDEEYDIDDEPDLSHGGYKPVGTDEVRMNKLH